MHEVLVNRLGGLSLPRKSVVRLTDRPDMTLDVYRGRKTTIQQQVTPQHATGCFFKTIGFKVWGWCWVLSVPGHPTDLDNCRKGANWLAIGADGDGLDIFFSFYLSSFLSLSGGWHNID